MHVHIPTPAEQELADEVAHLHLTTQLIRFLRTFALVLTPQLAFMPHTGTGWKALSGLLTAAAETTVRQLWPSLPLGPMMAVLQRLGHIPAGPVAPPAPTPTPVDIRTQVVPAYPTSGTAATQPVTWTIGPSPRTPAPVPPTAPPATTDTAPSDTPPPIDPAPTESSPS